MNIPPFSTVFRGPVWNVTASADPHAFSQADFRQPTLMVFGEPPLVLSPGVRYAGFFQGVAKALDEGRRSGNGGGFHFRGRDPHLRRGKHATVVIVEIEAPGGETFSCVLRNRLEDAENYDGLSRRHPEIRDIFACLYGFAGRWAVMERLQGLELDEIHARLRQEPALIPVFASRVLDVIETASGAGLRLWDTVFAAGHNVMFDPASGRIRLVEHGSPRPEPCRTPVELITQKIIEELESCALAAGDDIRGRYAFELMRQAFSRRPPEDYYLRSLRERIAPGHPRYRSEWERLFQFALTEEGYRAVLRLPPDRRIVFEEYRDAHRLKGLSVRFSDECVAAVLSGDEGRFLNVLRQGGFLSGIHDEGDPRSAPVYWPDLENLSEMFRALMQNSPSRDFKPIGLRIWRPVDRKYEWDFPVGARVLDLGCTEDRSENDKMPADLFERWAAYYERHLEERLAGGALSKWTEFALRRYRLQLNAVRACGQRDIRTVLQADNLFRLPPWSSAFPRFMREEGFDGIIVSQGHVSFLLYLLN